MVRLAGIEPATYSFGGCHSIQLSYSRTKENEVQYSLSFDEVQG